VRDHTATTAGAVTNEASAALQRPPPTTHLVTRLAIRACQTGHRVLLATATAWVTRVAEAHHAGRLQDELRRYPCGRRREGLPPFG
jgi:hypothetical protein